jgi:hypothetical protein
MITHHKFNPDRRTGWNMPPPNSTDFKAHSLGVKLVSYDIMFSAIKTLVSIVCKIFCIQNLFWF